MRVVRATMLIGLLSGVVTAFCAAALESSAFGQAPASDTRPVTLVVPIAAGGGVDTIARVFAALLSERLKQPWVVENRPGAGGLVGLDSVAKAPPDGHTLVTFETSAVLQQWLHRSVPFDVVADFSPVAQMATTPLVLFAGPSSPVADFKSLIAYAKANPGKLAVGTPGVGSPHSLAVMMLNAAAGIDITHVPYKGTAPALNDLLGGQIPLIWATPNVVMQYVATGKVKALAVGSPRRIALLPNVPTVSESGVAGFDVGVWFGIAGPAKTPPDVIARVGRQVAAIDAMADVRAKMAPLGYELDYADAEQFAKTVAADHARYGKVIRDAGIKPD
ncbi:MAG TPA: tripartite tricarboxylate transporter substrate binding protein [Xanthobacteraceae bacterium]|nr:tripartite tricarboxylate transporter substrate binding protein [Xanthobacteraceae bacterium]